MARGISQNWYDDIVPHMSICSANLHPFYNPKVRWNKVIIHTITPKTYSANPLDEVLKFSDHNDIRKKERNRYWRLLRGRIGLDDQTRDYIASVIVFENNKSK